MSDGDIWQLIMRHRQQVLARDAATLRRLTIDWLKVEQALADELAALSEEAWRLFRETGVVPQALRWKLTRFESLQRQLYARLNDYGAVVEELVTDGQRQLAEMAGIQFAEQMRAVGYYSGFNVLPTEAFEMMVGHVAQGAPLFEFFMQGLPEATVQAIADALEKGIALGWHPRKVARLMKEAAGLPHKRALTTARTEQLRVFRMAGLANYRESSVVDGWVWVATKDTRTCLACIDKDGSVHSLEEDFNDHPNGRCTQIAAIDGKPIVKFETGKEWFMRQPPEVQKQMMGPKKYAAWKGGRIAFSDLAQAHHHPTFGTHYSEASLKQALANAERRRAAA